MPNPAFRKVFRQLRRAALLSDGAGLNDAQLLECFLTDGDDAAFAALVRRHGPMVFGVCRRLLPTWQDAEDAFQATFLVLARKAGTIQPRGKVGNWLYGVAYRTALEAKSVLAKRRAKEKPLIEVAQPETEDESWQELQPLLDRELNRLPDKYRMAIICCDLQGKTRKEAARQLGWPEGTVATRLSRGRDLLRARLIRCGLTFSVGTLASLLNIRGASACVPHALEVCTVKAALVSAATTSIATGLVSAQVATLVQGVLKGMLFTKLKFAAGLLAVLGVIGFGTGVHMYARGTSTAATSPQVAAERSSSPLAQGGNAHPQAKETDRIKAVKEMEDRKKSKREEDDRKGKKIEKKKRGHEDEDEDDDEDRDEKKMRKKKPGVKKGEREDDDEDDDDEHESKKKAGAKKRERDGEKERGQKAKKSGKNKREREDDDEDDEHEGKGKARAKKGEREDGERGRELKKKSSEKKREREDEDDDEREGKKKSGAKKRRYEKEENERGRERMKKDGKKQRGHQDEDEDDEREGKKKSGKKNRRE